MDYDDFKKRLEASRKKNFEDFEKAFNQAMREQGSSKTLDTVLGEDPSTKKSEPAPKMPAWDEERSNQLAELFLDIYKETTDDDPRDVVLRAMACYRAFVKHARAGGQVKFVGIGNEKTLKVRLR